jgi:adenine phosphoribosyltransferase
MSIEAIRSAIRAIPDYPKKGILFRDITTLLQDAELVSEVIDIISERYQNNPPTKIIGIESRGFIFGMVLAYKLGIGFVPIRKKGKLPYKTFEASYDLEYGTATVEIHTDALTSDDRVVIVDDLLATGGTAAAAISLVEKFDAKIVGIDFVIELIALNGRVKLQRYPVNTVIAYE